MTRLAILDCSCSVKLKTKNSGKILKAKLVRCPDHKSKIKAMHAAFEATAASAAA